VRQILAVVGMPYSFFDSSKSSYSTHKADTSQYLISAAEYREAVKGVLHEMTEFIILNGISTGLIKLPDGMTYEAIDWEFYSTANNSLDPLKEASAVGVELANNTMSLTEACAIKGKDFSQVAE
jgi:hypothetical protein